MNKCQRAANLTVVGPENDAYLKRKKRVTRRHVKVVSFTVHFTATRLPSQFDSDFMFKQSGLNLLPKQSGGAMASGGELVLAAAVKTKTAGGWLQEESHLNAST